VLFRFIYFIKQFNFVERVGLFGLSVRMYAGATVAAAVQLCPHENSGKSVFLKLILPDVVF